MTLARPTRGGADASAPTIRVYSGPSRRSRALRTVLQVTVRPVIQAWGYAPNLPWPYGVIDWAAKALWPLPGTVVDKVRLPYCDGEFIRGPGAHSDRVVLYLHGGAFICCGPNTHRRFVSDISRACRAPALVVDYRMLPGHPVSTSLDDCVDGYRWLLQQGYTPDQIVVAGDSAGGYFALMTALSVVERGFGKPAAVVCQSPFIDTDPSRKLEWLGDMVDPLFPAIGLVSLIARMTEFERSNGVPDGYGRVHSPLYLDVSGLPPVLIQAGASELLSVDAELIAAKIAEEGVPCELQLFEGQFHVFQAAADLIPEGRKAIDNIGAFVRANVG